MARLRADDAVGGQAVAALVALDGALGLRPEDAVGGNAERALEPHHLALRLGRVGASCARARGAPAARERARARQAPAARSGEQRHRMLAVWAGGMWFVRLRGELTGSRFALHPGTRPGRFAPAARWPQWFPRSPDHGPRRLGVRRASFYQAKVLHVAGFLAVGSPSVKELTPGIRHWSAVHPNLGIEVSSYWLPDLGVLLDPIAVPAEVEGIERDRALKPPPPPRRARGARSASARACACRAPGVHEFEPDDPIEPYDFGEPLAGGAIIAPPSRPSSGPTTAALHIPSAARRWLSPTRSINYRGRLELVPDQLHGRPGRREPRHLRRPGPACRRARLRAPAARARHALRGRRPRDPARFAAGSLRRARGRPSRWNPSGVGPA